MSTVISDSHFSSGNAQRCATVLCVDDESNILFSLRRLLRPQGYHVLLAESGAAGLQMLSEHKVDLVISDMRMPEMDGATFLEQVSTRWPYTVRILLTGYADLSSTIAAVNKGNIYRYLSKPWEDADVLLAVRQGLEQKFLREDRDRLLVLTDKQNRELKKLNTSLEDQVRARTEEIQQTADMLDLAYQELKRSYVDAIPVFASLLELREGQDSGHSRRVAEMAQDLAVQLKLEESQVEQIYFAGLLHDIGKIGLPDNLLATPFSELSLHEQRTVMKHPTMGEAALMSLEPMLPTAEIIRHHHERFDGKGYPDQLAGDEIPLGARILAIVNDYDALQQGTLQKGKFTPAQAVEYLQQGRGTRYDPQLLDRFLERLTVQLQEEELPQISLETWQLKNGMVLAADIRSPDGLLLLVRGHRITDNLIERLLRFERESETPFVIQVYANPKERTNAPHNAG